MSESSSFWSRTYSIRSGRVILNLYFGEVKVSEFNQLLAEAIAAFDNIGVAHENLLLTCNRAGMHLSNFVRLDAPAIELVREKLEAGKWKMASD